jgi:hypothetical protein
LLSHSNYRYIAHRQTGAAFDKWVEFTEESIEMKVKLNRAIKKMLNRQMSGAFDRWWGCTSWNPVDALST